MIGFGLLFSGSSKIQFDFCFIDSSNACTAKPDFKDELLRVVVAPDTDDWKIIEIKNKELRRRINAWIESIHRKNNQDGITITMLAIILDVRRQSIHDVKNLTRTYALSNIGEVLKYAVCVGESFQTALELLDLADRAWYGLTPLKREKYKYFLCTAYDDVNCQDWRSRLNKLRELLKT